MKKLLLEIDSAERFAKSASNVPKKHGSKVVAMCGGRVFWARLVASLILMCCKGLGGLDS